MLLLETSLSNVIHFEDSDSIIFWQMIVFNTLLRKNADVSKVIDQKDLFFLHFIFHGLLQNSSNQLLFGFLKQKMARSE